MGIRQRDLRESRGGCQHYQLLAKLGFGVIFFWVVWGELESESAEGSGDEARGQTDETEETLIPPRDSNGL